MSCTKDKKVSTKYAVERIAHLTHYSSDECCGKTDLDISLDASTTLIEKNVCRSRDPLRNPFIPKKLNRALSLSSALNIVIAEVNSLTVIEKHLGFDGLHVNTSCATDDGECVTDYNNSDKRPAFGNIL